MKKEKKQTFTYSGRPSIREKAISKSLKEGITFSEKVDQLLEQDIKPDVAYAVKVLTSALKKDKGFYISYQSNIAVAFMDECQRQGYPRGSEDAHRIANKAAENFLNMWIKS